MSITITTTARINRYLSEMFGVIAEVNCHLSITFVTRTNAFRTIAKVNRSLSQVLASLTMVNFQSITTFGTKAKFNSCLS